MRYHDEKKQEAEVAAMAGMIAGGAVSFFTLGLGTFAATAAGAGAAKLLDDQAERYKENYKNCLREEREEEQRKSQRRAQARKRKKNKAKNNLKDVNL